MKRILTFLLALVMLLSLNASASFADIDSSSAVGNAVNQLSELGIINGYPDGTFRLDETLTRAQFAKIAVHMLGEEKTASSRAANAVFSDVSEGHWASGYINYIAEREIINGYPDGSFGAEDTINYAQALTILVRLLGYGGEDVGYKWPEGYITKAKSLGVTDAIEFGTYENVTRGNAAYIVYNTLLADKKEGSSVKLLSSSSAEDVVIYGDSSIDASIAHGNIVTTKGTYKLADSTNISESMYGRMGTVYLDKEGRATAFVPENETVRSITLSGGAVSGDGNRVEISFTENGAVKTESFSAGAPLYYSGRASSLSDGVNEMEAGREAVLYYSENGSFARMYMKESTLSGPLTVTTGYSQIYTAFRITDSNAMKVIRDGRNSSLSEIAVYDVVYYMKGNNTLYVYTDKASGTYEEAYPLKANVTSVKVAGKQYALSTQAAIGKMNTSENAFELGERVTLLFGRNGEVVDVVDLASGGGLDLAVLAKSYKEISEDADRKGESIHYVSVVLPDGNEVTYEADKDYSDYTGCVVKVEYTGKTAKLSVLRHSAIYGDFDASARTLDGHWISDNCRILELVKNTQDGATVKKIELREIQAKNLTKNQVIHAETSGELKDITFLFVTDVTKADAKFGVVTEVSGNSYTVLVDNKTVNIKTALSLSGGSAVEIEETSDGQIPRSLIKIGTGNRVEGYSSGRIRVDGKNYNVSDYVKIYGGAYAGDFESMSMTQIVNSEKVKQVTLYSDRSLASGGTVRVIVAVTD